MKVLYPTQLSSSGNSTPVPGLTEGQSKVKALGLAARFSVRCRKGRKDDSDRRPSLDMNFLAISVRDEQDRSTALTFFFWERMKNIQTIVFI